MSGPSKQEWGKSAYIQKRDDAQRSARKSKEHQETITAINAVADQLSTDQGQQNTSENKRALREKVTIGLLIATVIAAGAGDVIFYLTMRDARIAAAGAHTDNSNALTQAAAANRATSQEAQQNRIEGSRAWVGPSTAAIDVVPTAGQSIVGNIGYQNTGREPARNFVWFANPFVMSVADDAKGKLAPLITDYMVKCFHTPTGTNSGVVYPSTGFTGNTLRVTYDGKNVDQSLVEGRSMLIIQGCFVYMTFNQPHHSAFCMFYRGVSPLKPGETAKPPNLNLSNCLTGNNAD